MKNTLKRILAVSLIAASFSASYTEQVHANSLGIATGSVAALAAASVLGTIAAKRKSARLSAKQAGDYFSSAGSSIKRTAENMGTAVKEGAQALKRDAEVGAYAFKETDKAQRTLSKIQRFFAEHGIETSAACVFLTLLLGGLYLQSKGSTK
ncbi:MAG: hypothetical protein QG604_436 [Candidatus Dependentiae bacterium]|nr:hypothetical protein [Candidatus Dependentiae bacterium]